MTPTATYERWQRSHAISDAAYALLQKVSLNTFNAVEVVSFIVSCHPKTPLPFPKETTMWGRPCTQRTDATIEEGKYQVQAIVQ